MAVEVFPDAQSIGISPRISFSHDLPQNDTVPVERHIRSSSPSAIDFDFCVFRQSFDHEPSSADELFLDGKILPIEIKKRFAPPRAPDPPPKPTDHEKQSVKSTTSFWRFKRSTSLNCGSGYGGTLCPLPLLSRSNSTGSNSSVKRSSSISNNQKQNCGNVVKYSLPNSSLKPSTKPPLKKSTTSYGSYTVKFNPVLNVPPVNLFGLASIFSSGKDRTKKK